MLGAAAAYVVAAALMLRFAGGGMERIVQKMGEEYHDVASARTAAPRAC
jgi:hypothetical protein